ncbi:MAG TPA: cytochrome c oxidase subunit II [Terriglobales bacterium]|jgi:cytochrome c oxidase subunit 2
MFGFSPSTNRPALTAFYQAASLNPGQHSALHAAAPQAAHIEWLYWAIFWICFGAFVLTVAAFARGSARTYIPQAEPLPPIKEHPNDRKAVWCVGGAIAVTVLSLFAVLFMSVVTGKQVEGATAERNVLTIQITGHQWWWEAQYPNSQADQTITTANEIHVPVGRRVMVLTNSADVIHSFWAPSITGKRDLVPGYSSAFAFQVDKPGSYHGQCAEFCGLQHAHMGFAVIAEPEDQFEEWERQQIAPARDPSTPEELRGRQVFLTHACVMCHTLRGTDAASRVGPDLTHIASRKMIAAETLPNTRGALAGWISDPQIIKPGNRMTPNPMQPDDLQDLITYLGSLQ